MRDEKIIRYEKPELVKYAFYGAKGVVIGAGDSPEQGDITEVCDSDFDE